MTTSPLQLDEVFVGEVNVKPSEGPLAALAHADWLVDAKPSYGRNAENPLKWHVKLSVDFRAAEQKPVSYEGHINCEGYFTVTDAALSEQKQRKLVAVNAATILYSTVREVVATITARARNGKFLLPSVSFIDQGIILPDDPKPETPQSEQVASAPPRSEGQ
jgi:preprotein translocase subunit SecB